MRYLAGIIAVVFVSTTGCGGVEQEQYAPGFSGGKGDSTRAENVLLIPLNHQESNKLADFESDENCFYDNALKLQSFYRTRGARATILITNTPETLRRELEHYKSSGEVFDRMVFIGHGTTNGPTFCCGYSPQIGYDYPLKGEHKLGNWNMAYLYRMGAVIADVLVPWGWLYIGSCNAGTEGSSFEGFDRFTEVVSCVTGRVSYGMATSTACWDVTERVKKLEQGRMSYMLHKTRPEDLDESLVCYGDELPPELSNPEDPSQKKPEPEPEPETPPEPEPDPNDPWEEDDWP